MQRIEPVIPEEAIGKAKQLLEGVQATLGMIPNLMKTLASAPAALLLEAGSRAPLRDAGPPWHGG